MTPYQKALLKIRATNNKWQSWTTARIVQALEEAYKAVDTQLARAGEGSLTYANLAERKQGIEKNLTDLGVNVKKYTMAGIKNFSKDATKTYLAATLTISKTANLKGFYGLDRKVLANVVNRIWSDGFNFSDRIWNLSNYAKTGTNQILAAGIAQGESAITVSKELRKYLLEPDITDTTSWTQRALKSTTGRGSIHYNALRLAKTEINNSYREQQVLSAKASPVVLGIQWNLSADHDKEDVCDLYAEADLFGLGAGVYPPDNVPVDHPFGNCYLTDVIRPAEDWKKPKEEYEIQEPKDKTLSGILAGSGFSDAYVQRQIATFRGSVPGLGG